MTDRSGPIFYVKVSPRGRPGEQSERIDVSTKVTSFSYEDDESKADKLMIEIDNYDLSEIDSGRWVEGQTLEVAWGYQGNLSPARSCVIKKVTPGPRKLKIEAHGEAVLMDRDIRSKTFENMKRSEVVQEIALANGYGLDRLHIQGTEIRFDSIVQARMSDAQFLRHLANREGFEFFVDFDGLHWHERDLGQKPIREVTYFTDKAGEIIDWSVEGNLTNRASTVKTKGRDPIAKTDIEGEANNSTETGRNTLGSVVISVDPRTGERSTNPAVENTRHEEVQPTTETSADAAQREAAGRFKKSSVNSFKLKLKMVGDPGLVAKSVINVKGISERLSGRYYVSKVKHDLTRGYQLDVLCKRDAASRGNGVAGDGAEATGKQNTQQADASDEGSLSISVDPRTGSRTFRDTRGR